MASRGDDFWKIVLAGSLLVLGLAGCSFDQKTPSHKEEVKNANTRWLTMRSNMMLHLAQQQFDTGDLDQSEKTLVNAIGADPKNPRLYVLAGRIGIERGQLEHAYDRLATAITLDPALGEAYYFQGFVLQRWQRYDDALAAYRNAYRLQADNPAFLLAIAEMLTITDHNEEAIALLVDKVAYFDQNAGVRAALGQLYANQKQYDKAVELYRQASLLRPTDLQLTECMALAELEAGQYADAIVNLERLSDEKSYADRADIQLSLARAYEQSNRLNDARNIYARFTRTTPQDPQPWLKLSQIAWSQGDLSATLLAANRAAALAPNDPQSYLMAGLVWQKRGNTTEALRNFDKAAELAPKSNEAVLLRGITLQRAGQPAAAAAAYAEALRRAPDDARARSLLASVEQP